MRVRRMRGRTVIAVASAVAVFSLTGASWAQTIAADATPAPTVDNQSVDISEQRFDAPRRRVSLFVEFNSNAQYSSNILSVSNLTGGLELEPDSGWFWQNGLAATLAVPVGERVLLFAQAGASYVDYADYSQLNYIGLSTTTGAQFALGRSGRAFAAVSCSSERDEDFKEYYSTCSPSAGLSVAAGNPRRGSYLQAGLNGSYAMGEKERFARYTTANAFVSWEFGGDTRFRLRPQVNGRWYDTPDIIARSRADRSDYQVGVQAALYHRGRNLEYGFMLDPRVNWSNYGQYRYWDVRGGPYLRVRFGR